VDLRSEEEYIQGHISGSTNVPWPTVEAATRVHELPPRGAELDVFVGWKVFSSMKSKTGVEGEENFLVNFLKKAGYKLVWRLGFFKTEEEELDFWKTLRKQEEGKGEDEEEGGREGMFESGSKSRSLWLPGPFLLEVIQSIEEGLEKTQTTSPWNVLDLACGSGRDLVFLAKRRRRTNFWASFGVDRDDCLLGKATELAGREGLSVGFKLLLHLKNLDLEAPDRAPEDLLTPLLEFLASSFPETSSTSSSTSTSTSTSTSLSPSAEVRRNGFDLVHVARYLHRPLFPLIKALVTPLFLMNPFPHSFLTFSLHYTRLLQGDL
jgi:SAM-dependent methyltransferase